MPHPPAHKVRNRGIATMTALKMQSVENGQRRRSGSQVSGSQLKKSSWHLNCRRLMPTPREGLTSSRSGAARSASLWALESPRSQTSTLATHLEHLLTVIEYCEDKCFECWQSCRTVGTDANYGQVRPEVEECVKQCGHPNCNCLGSDPNVP
jgi:hypothetical protein